LGGEGHRACTWVLHVPGQDGRREKMVNKYAAIVYIRLNASMIKPKKKGHPTAPTNYVFPLVLCGPTFRVDHGHMYST